MLTLLTGEVFASTIRLGGRFRPNTSPHREGFVTYHILLIHEKQYQISKKRAKTRGEARF